MLEKQVVLARVPVEIESSYALATGDEVLLGEYDVPLFGEGIAVWLDGEGEASHHDAAAKLLREKRLPSLETLLKRFRDDEGTSYAAAGSFTGFVISTCGIDAFKRMYLAADPIGAAPEVIGKSLADLDAEVAGVAEKLDNMSEHGCLGQLGDHFSPRPPRPPRCEKSTAASAIAAFERIGRRALRVGIFT